MERFIAYFLQILVLVIWAAFLPQVSAQQFIYSCKDSRIIEHTVKWGHTYCSHACDPDFPPNPANTSVCSNSGTCLCQQNCYNETAPPPPKPVRNDICPINPPPPVGEDVTIPNSIAKCQAICSMECPGGFGGTQCTETAAALIPITRVCTCLCPAQPCIPCTTTTTTTTTTATTTTNIITTTIIIKPTRTLTTTLIIKPTRTLTITHTITPTRTITTTTTPAPAFIPAPLLIPSLIPYWIYMKIYIFKLILLICYNAILVHFIVPRIVERFIRWFITFITNF